MFYCAGFLRVELEAVKKQKKRINALENNEETTSSNVPNQLTKKTRGNKLPCIFCLALIPEKSATNVFLFFLHKQILLVQKILHIDLVCLRVRGAA